MHAIKELWSAFFIILTGWLALTYFLPVLPIDETRYLSVAWEMRLNHSFFVPILNGQPYFHKPPLFFWLIQAGWHLFGVNTFVPRLIPLLFSLANIVLTFCISRQLWPEKTDIAKYASIILASMFIWIVFSSLIMFDILLTFWVLTGILGILHYSNDYHSKKWLLFAIAIGGGLLTKGPVILVHILPAAIFVFMWEKNKIDFRWYKIILFSLLIGIAIVLLWVIPAIIKGGEVYRNEILWGQTANRMFSSFAHQRPFWWYLLFLPLLLFPWSVLKISWAGFFPLKNDRGCKFLMVWLISALIIFSIVSCKQIHYLIPELPAASLLIAYNIMNNKVSYNKFKRNNVALGLFYILLGAVLFGMPFMHLGSDVGQITIKMIVFAAVSSIFLGIILIVIKYNTLDIMVKIVALSTVTFIIIFLNGAHSIRPNYDLEKISHLIKIEQDQGKKIAYVGHYHGQFQFLGLLKSPLIVFKKRDDGLAKFIKKNPDLMIITTMKAKIIIPPENIVFMQPYKTRKLVLMDAQSFLQFKSQSLNLPGKK